MYGTPHPVGGGTTLSPISQSLSGNILLKTSQQGGNSVLSPNSAAARNHPSWPGFTEMHTHNPLTPKNVRSHQSTEQGDLPFFFQQTGRMPSGGGGGSVNHIASTDAMQGDVTSGSHFNTFSGSGAASFGDSTSRVVGGGTMQGNDYGGGGTYNSHMGQGQFAMSLQSNVSSGDPTPTNSQPTRQHQQVGHIFPSPNNPAPSSFAALQHHHQPLFSDHLYAAAHHQHQHHNMHFLQHAPINMMGGGYPQPFIPQQQLHGPQFPGGGLPTYAAHRSPPNHQQQQQGPIAGVCKDHIVGRCTRPNCRFLHLPTSVRPLPEDVCKDFIRGSCSRPVCRFFHGTPEELTRLKSYQQSHPELLVSSTGETLTAEQVSAAVLHSQPLPSHASDGTPSVDGPSITMAPSANDHDAVDSRSSSSSIHPPQPPYRQGADLTEKRAPSRDAPAPPAALVINAHEAHVSPTLTPTRHADPVPAIEAHTAATVDAIRMQLLATQAELHDCQLRVASLSNTLAAALTQLDALTTPK